MPGNTILVPGTFARGSLIYSLNVGSSQVMLEGLLASEYAKFSALPDLRPSRPLSSGPTLFLASAPTAWQGRHFLKDVSPAATSWAWAFAPDTTKAAATTKILIMHLLYGNRGDLRPWR